MPQELIIGLTQHRTFGYIFQAFLIERKVSFYTISKLVKQRDISALKLTGDQAELVRLAEQYSDEKLVQKFSKKKESSKFFQQIDSSLFEDHISPYIDSYMARIVPILMRGSTRLFYKQAKYSNLYDEDLIDVHSSFTQCCFRFERRPEGTRYYLDLTQDGEAFHLHHKQLVPVTNEPGSFVHRNKLYAFGQLTIKKLLPFLEKDHIFIASSVEEKYYRSFVLNAIKEFPVAASGFTIHDGHTTPSAILSLEQDWRLNSTLSPRFRYGEQEYASTDKSGKVVHFENKNGDYIFHKIDRDQSWEEHQLTKLKELGLSEENGSFCPKDILLLEGDDRLYELLSWLNKHSAALAELGFEISQDKLNSVYSLDHQQLDIQVKESEDWFDVYANVQFGEFQIPFIKLKKHILNGIREFQLPNGEIAILPKEWFTEYGDILPFARTEGNHLRLKKFHYQLLQQKLKGIDKSFFNRLQDINTNAGKTIVQPKTLQATLRSYQQEGFSWMYNLYENGFGGCLADDMGLGKTLQTLTLLLKLKRLKQPIAIPDFESVDEDDNLFSEANAKKAKSGKDAKAGQAASLIVMPTSLLHNWANEIQKFTPDLKVYKHFGFQRKRNSNLRALANYYDLIITSYGTMRNDFDLLKDIEFFYVILDESQTIKNPGSKTYQAIVQLKAQHKLVLTGTPIENSLSDLWAQMNFVNKGLLGNLAYFKREFITPIEKKNDPDKQQKLQTLIQPFILRRTKEQVANDLPPITEQVRYCGMAGDQKRIYEEEKSAIRNSILENIENEGVEKSAFVVLQGLTKLRQLANHPSMLQGTDESDSGKFNEILRIMESLIAEKHKVLIFSSFVKHLDLVREQLESRQLKYSMLTGQTTNREDVIKSFQDDPDNRVFLISLKAGGVGLNLTSADYVFIIDPWWNPAIELQAIARAHRIGQEKKVMVYRFITEDSIEEKIMQMQERKSSLADKFINSNNPFKAITKEEIINLFK